MMALPVAVFFALLTDHQRDRTANARRIRNTTVMLAMIALHVKRICAICLIGPFALVQLIESCLDADKMNVLSKIPHGR